jgi:hypothetical protein
MLGFVGGLVLILFGVCVLITMWGISPPAAVLGVALYGGVLLWRRGART